MQTFFPAASPPTITPLPRALPVDSFPGDQILDGGFAHSNATRANPSPKGHALLGMKKGIQSVYSFLFCLWD